MGSACEVSHVECGGPEARRFLEAASTSIICYSDTGKCHDCEEIFQNNRMGEPHHGAYKTVFTEVILVIITLNQKLIKCGILLFDFLRL